MSHWLLSDAVFEERGTYVDSSDLRLNRYYLRLGDRLHKPNPIPPKGTLHLHLKFTNRCQLARGLSTSEAVGRLDWEAIFFFFFLEPGRVERLTQLHFISTAGFPSPLPLRIACCLTLPRFEYLIAPMSCLLPILLFISPSCSFNDTRFLIT